MALSKTNLLVAKQTKKHYIVDRITTSSFTVAIQKSNDKYQHWPVWDSHR